MPKEIVVVEGKDDAAAVKKACQAEVIITNGLGISKEILQQIRTAQKRCGVIILTDPDFAGEKIRRIIEQAVPGCRHARITQEKKDKIGVEYATGEEIKDALARAHLSFEQTNHLFNIKDLLSNNLMGNNKARERRFQAGGFLGLGKTNGKQFLNRLNAYRISRQEFEEALDKLEE